MMIMSTMLLKPVFYKNNAKPPIVTQHLHDSAPNFGACLPEIWGQDRANFVDSRRLCVILIKNNLMIPVIKLIFYKNNAKLPIATHLYIIEPEKLKLTLKKEQIR